MFLYPVISASVRSCTGLSTARYLCVARYMPEVTKNGVYGDGPITRSENTDGSVSFGPINISKPPHTLNENTADIEGGDVAGIHCHSLSYLLPSSNTSKFIILWTCSEIPPSYRGRRSGHYCTISTKVSNYVETVIYGRFCCVKCVRRVRVLWKSTGQNNFHQTLMLLTSFLYEFEDGNVLVNDRLIFVRCDEIPYFVVNSVQAVTHYFPNLFQLPHKLSWLWFFSLYHFYCLKNIGSGVGAGVKEVELYISVFRISVTGCI